MGKQKRARTRAVRAEMGKTGENYTRAAARAAHAARAQDRSSTDAVREHVRRCLRANLDAEEARMRRVEELEHTGHRIVDGGQEGPESWAIYDWRTRQLLARGDDGLEGYDATTDSLDPDNRWFHCDHLDEDVVQAPVETPGVPPSLGRAIEDWLDQLRTPDEEVSEITGWPIDEVRVYRG